MNLNENAQSSLLKNQDKENPLNDSFQNSFLISRQQSNNLQRETGRSIWKNQQKQSILNDDAMNQSLLSIPSNETEKHTNKCQKLWRFLVKCFSSNKANQQIDPLDLSAQNCKAFQNYIEDTGTASQDIKAQDKKHENNKQNETSQQLNNHHHYQNNPQNKLSFFQQLKLKITQPFDVIEPENKYLLIWEGIVVVFIMFYFILIPLQFFFWKNIKRGDQQIRIQSLFEFDYNVLMIFILLFDLLLYFNVGIYTKGFITKERKKIRKLYLSSLLFWINVLALIVPLNDTFRYDNSLLFLDFIFFLKAISIIKFNRKIIRIVQLRKKLKFLYQMIRLFMVILYIGHFMGCLYFGYSYYIHSVYPSLATWLQNSYRVQVQQKDLYLELQSNWWICYFWSFYWSMTTMIQGGFGDVGPPQNVFEASFVILFDIFVYVMFAFFMNVIWDYISEYRMYKEKWENQKCILNRFMKIKQTSPDIQIKIDAYMDYLTSQKHLRDEEQELQVLSKLPQKLKEDLIFDAQGYFLEHIPWLKNNFSELFLRKISHKIEEINIMEKEILFDDYSTEESDIALYYIESGSVEAFFDLKKYNGSKGIPLGKYKAGDLFNSYYFVINQANIQSIRIVKPSLIYKIQRKHFIECLEGLQEDKEKFYQIYNQVLFEQNLGAINYQCRICFSKNHLSSKCPQINFNIDTEQLLESNQYKEFSRSKYFIHEGRYRKRRLHKEVPALENIYEVRQAAFQILHQLQLNEEYFYCSTYDENGQKISLNHDNISNDYAEEEGIDDDKSNYNNKEKLDNQEWCDIEEDKENDENNEIKSNNDPPRQTHSILSQQNLFQQKEQINPKRSFVQQQIPYKSLFQSDKPKKRRMTISSEQQNSIQSNLSQQQQIQQNQENQQMRVSYQPHLLGLSQNQGLGASGIQIQRKQEKNSIFSLKSRASIKFISILQKKQNNNNNTPLKQNKEENKIRFSKGNEEIVQNLQSQINSNYQNKRKRPNKQRKKQHENSLSKKHVEFIDTYVQYQHEFNAQLMQNIQDIYLLQQKKGTDKINEFEDEIYLEQQNNPDNINVNSISRNVNFNIDKVHDFKQFQNEQNLSKVINQINQSDQSKKAKNTFLIQKNLNQLKSINQDNNNNNKASRENVQNIKDKQTLKLNLQLPQLNLQLTSPYSSYDQSYKLERDIINSNKLDNLEQL